MGLFRTGPAITPSSGIDPGSKSFQAAQQACRTNLPTAVQPTPAQQARIRSQLLKLSACMRSHGVPNFPDPQFSGGDVRVGVGQVGGRLQVRNSIRYRAVTDRQLSLAGMRLSVRSVLAAAVLASLGSLVAGCGGGHPGAAVANLGTTTGGTDTTANATGNATASAGGGGGGGGGRMMMTGGSVQQMTKFSACMRKNGVPNFPDPNAQGQISISSAAGIDAGSAAFQHAQQACQKELPNHGQPTAAQQAQARQQALAFSACMRKNGVPNFPDPQFQAGGRIAIHIGSSAGIDPQSPQFKHAQQVCQKDAPFGKGAPVTGKAGG
jgi:hypothetical protein